MSDSASAQSVVARKSPRGSLIQMAVVIGLAVFAGAAFETLRPSPARAGQAGGNTGQRVQRRRRSSIAADRHQPRCAAGYVGSARGVDLFDPKTLPHPEAVASQIGDDILAYLRTVSLHQLEGPIGLENIRQDLNERAATRSGGKVHALVIKTLVVQ